MSRHAAPLPVHMEHNCPKHLSMLRSYTTADFFTLANASCGTLAILLCLGYIAEGAPSRIWLAVLLLCLAFVFDVLDGYWARKSRRKSLLGADLDSLSDIVSFGVAPAVLGYALGLRGGWDLAILTYFVACGISRLARFNVTAEELSAGTGKVKYFEGTPIPTSIVIVLLLAAAFHHGAVPLTPAPFHLLSLLYGASGSAMISATLRIPKP